ncbi:MAG: protein kinase domain-containing protein, partial [Gemmatimonadales bacterium]
IKTTAALSHPHILPLFDSGSADGQLYYVMPYIQGETVREKLDRETQFAIDDAVRITTEVADALDYAHRHGVIHRDIKPENILLHDSRPMVMDFGIALAVSAAAGGRMTETGLSLGTPHYMSPEQATAERTITNRSDIYSLASVMYEMLTGQPPHLGGTAQQIIMKIVTQDVRPVTELRRSVPPNVAAALAQALQKLPADRFDTARGFADALLDPAFWTGRRETATDAGRRWTWSIAAASLVGGIVIGLGVGRASLQRDSPDPERFVVVLPDSAPLIAGAGVNLAWTPDGSRIVYVGPSPGGEAQLWQRRIDDLRVEPIAGTEAARIPVVSPNDSSVAFTAQDALKIVPLYGGPAVTLVASGVPSAGGGLAWGDDGHIYFVDQTGAIEQVPASGGPPSVVLSPDSASGGGYMWIDALPDHAGLLFTIALVGIPEASEIAAVPVAGGPPRRLVRGTMARYVRSGYLVFVSAEGTLMAAPFDARRLAVTGTPVAVGQGIDVYMGSATQFAVSRAGAIAWVHREQGHEIFRVDRHGVGEPLESSVADDADNIALSPDGQRLAVTTLTSAGAKVWIKDLRGGPMIPVPMPGTHNYGLGWSPDGRTLAVVSNQAGPGQLWLTRVDRVGAAERVPFAGTVYDASWAPDGVELVVATATPGGTSALVALRPGRDSLVRPLVGGHYLLEFPSVSPDSRWLLYSSNESGHDEVYVVPFRGESKGKWQVSTNGGIEPVWARSGRELFYRSASGDLTAVSIDVDPSRGFHAGPPRPLFQIGAASDNRAYVVTADDQHFILVRRARPAESELVVGEHFDTELGRRLGR